MIDLVILDMDGLLIDSEPYWQAAERKLFSSMGITITEEMQHETFGLRADEQIDHWYALFPWDNPDFKAVERGYYQIMQDFFLNEAVLKPGAEYILDFFDQEGIPMALASSSDMALIETFVDRFGFRDRFKLLASAEHEEYGKPHPAVYLNTADQLQVSPVRCLAFEDSLAGVIAARAARMKVVAVPDTHHYDLSGYGVANLKLRSLKDFNQEMYQSLKGNHK